MDPINHFSFWTMENPVLTLLIGIISTVIIFWFKESLNRKTKIKLEKLKLYDKKRFDAYYNLYEFISKCYAMFPLENPRGDFVYLIKEQYFQNVRKYLPYFRKDIRSSLKTIESQYDCLNNSDFHPKIPFDKFVRSNFLDILNTLNSEVEKIFDKWE